MQVGEIALRGPTRRDAPPSAPCSTRPCAERPRGPRRARRLAVRVRWRRRGLARALLLEALELLRSRRLRRAALGVEAESTTGALTLYEGAGMRVNRTDTWDSGL